MTLINKSSFEVVALKLPCYNGNNKSKVGKKMDPETSKVIVQLSEIAIKNTATIVHDKIATSKAKRNDKETIAELTDIIQDLLSDKQDLQIISDEDLTFIAQTVIPTIEKIVPDDNDDMISNIDKIKPLLSRNTLNVLQTLGFNFKRGIGEPLTDLLNSVIKDMNKKQSNEFSIATVNRDTEYFRLIQNEEAFNRWQNLQK